MQCLLKSGGEGDDTDLLFLGQIEGIRATELISPEDSAYALPFDS